MGRKLLLTIFAFGLPFSSTVFAATPLLGSKVNVHAGLAEQAGSAQVHFEFDDPPIRYASSKPDDSITRLQRQIDSGRIKLSFDVKHGFLASLLKTLKIPQSSQMLVFSKTSVQRKLISPETPRALYFNDGTYIGWVPGSPALEIASVDPRLGPVYYVLPQDKTRPPRFERQAQECLLCHGSVLTSGFPGHLMRSIYTGPDGGPLATEESFLTSDASPMDKRWGGWYVTGKSGAQLHMGNHTANDEGAIDRKSGSNITDLRPLLKTPAYLTPHSDIVALMVLGHQTSVQNLISRASYEIRLAQYRNNAAADGGARNEEEREVEARLEITRACEPLVKGLLFSGAEPLISAISGTSGFAEEFPKHGPRDKLGRSLRDLDLRRRLLKYSCSYLIYSKAFDALPMTAKEYCYRRLFEVLTGRDRTPGFAHLSASGRKAILEILMDTKPEFSKWITRYKHPLRPAT